MKKTKKPKPKAVMAWAVADADGIYKAFIRRSDAEEERAWSWDDPSVSVIRVRIVPVAKKRRAKR